MSFARFYIYGEAEVLGRRRDQADLDASLLPQIARSKEFEAGSLSRMEDVLISWKLEESLLR